MGQIFSHSWWNLCLESQRIAEENSLSLHFLHRSYFYWKEKGKTIHHDLLEWWRSQSEIWLLDRGWDGRCSKNDLEHLKVSQTTFKGFNKWSPIRNIEFTRKLLQSKILEFLMQHLIILSTPYLKSLQTNYFYILRITKQYWIFSMIFGRKYDFTNNVLTISRKCLPGLDFTNSVIAKGFRFSIRNTSASLRSMTFK